MFVLCFCIVDSVTQVEQSLLIDKENDSHNQRVVIVLDESPEKKPKPAPLLITSAEAADSANAQTASRKRKSDEVALPIEPAQEEAAVAAPAKKTRQKAQPTRSKNRAR